MPVELLPAIRRKAEKSPLTGRHVFFGMLAFFAVILAVNVTMMTLAIRTMPGTGARSAYEASQRFNRELETIAAQDSRGWQVDILTTGLRGGGPFDLNVRDRRGEALGGLRVQARLERPTDARLDELVLLNDLGGGRYRALLPALAAGQWSITVELYRNEEQQFVSRRRIMLKE